MDTPFPSSGIVMELLPEELFVMTRAPSADPATVGWKRTFTIADCPGDNVAGKVNPDIVKLLPETLTALMMTGNVPNAVSVRDWVATEFRITGPNEAVFELLVSID